MMDFRSSLTRFRRAEDGTAAILWAISLVVVFAFAALAFDIGRLGATQSELQSFADNVALAAAGELDGKSDAVTRAQAAAANLISDSQTFANGDQALAGTVDYTLTFYASLPADDTAPMTDVTTDPADAVYAEVVVTPHSVSTVFRAATNALLGGAGGGAAAVGATAVAGYTQEACDITPLMFCLPPGFTASEQIGTMINLRSGGGGSAWGPGNFGFLDPEGGVGDTCDGLTGANLYRCLVGAELNITQCVSQRGVDMRTGQQVGLAEAFNVRFGIYRATMNNEKNNPTFSPAPNVISGVLPDNPNSCNWANPAASDAVALPKDSCFATGTCAHGNRFGNGVWDYAGYIAANHGGSDAHLTAYAVDPQYAGTRYETYLREIQHGNANASGNILDGLLDTGRPLPACNGANMSSRPQRRVLVAAGIDCVANNINGATDDVPVEEFVELFLTHPVGDDGTNNFDIWVEVIGSAGGDGYSSAGPGGIFRDVVQLYR